MRAAAGMVCALLALAVRARAEDLPHELRHDVAIDLSVTIGLGTGLVVSELLKSSIVSPTCHWCDRSGSGDHVPGIDRAARDALRWSDTKSADVTSYVTAFALAPIAAFGLTTLAARDSLRTAPVDALIITESTFAALGIDQITKFLAQRERPFVHFRSPADRAALAASDDNVSFFSGHTTAAFALATSAGTVAQMRGYRMDPVIWATGLSLACLSGYLRIAADKHYLTDVVTGVVVGTAVGIGVPLLFHGRSAEAPRSPTVTIQPKATGLSFAGVF